MQITFKNKTTVLDNKIESKIQNLKTKEIKLNNKKITINNKEIKLSNKKIKMENLWTIRKLIGLTETLM